MRNTYRNRLLMVAVSLGGLVVSLDPQQRAGAQETVQSGSVTTASLPVGEIVRRLDARNRERAAALIRFEGTRVYRMHYQGFFGSRDAEMKVFVKASPGGKEFTIESQSGSSFIIKRVFMRLLDTEKEATSEESRQRTALSEKNYDFALTGFEASPKPVYILKVDPKTDEKLLYRGKIWVDATDFAVTRIEGEPAKNPSMWIKKTSINHEYVKVDDFWLPAENRTESTIRLGGHALLSIDYKDYKITEAKSVEPGTNANGYPPSPSRNCSRVVGCSNGTSAKADLKADPTYFLLEVSASKLKGVVK